MRFVRTHSRGFTLFEVLIVAILLVVIGGGLLTTFLTGQTSYFSADASIQVQQEARRAFDNVVRELRESGTISCGSAPPATCAAGSPCTCAANNLRLNFQIAQSYDATNGIVWGDGVTEGRFVHYTFVTTGTNTQLVRYTDTAAAGGGPPSPCSPAVNCCVLANNVNTAVVSGQPASGFLATDISTPPDGRPDVVTLNLQITYSHPALPGGNRTTGVLSSRVQLRNPS